jgi:hypothetical protein
MSPSEFIWRTITDIAVDAECDFDLSPVVSASISASVAVPREKDEADDSDIDGDRQGIATSPRSSRYPVVSRVGTRLLPRSEIDTDDNEDLSSAPNSTNVAAMLLFRSAPAIPE